MAYTRAWTDTTPADTDQASTLGAVTRNLRTDIEERMNTLLGASQWDVDPVAALPLTKVLYFPPVLGYSSDPANTVVDYATAGDQQSVHSGSVGTISLYVPIVLPIGATLTKVRCALRNTNISSNIRGFAVWNSVLIGTPAVTSLGQTTLVSAVTALAWYDFGVASHLVAAGDCFTGHITLTGGGTAHYHGLEVTYTMPNLLVTY